MSMDNLTPLSFFQDQVTTIEKDLGKTSFCLVDTVNAVRDCWQLTPSTFLSQKSDDPIQETPAAEGCANSFFLVKEFSRLSEISMHLADLASFRDTGLPQVENKRKTDVETVLDTREMALTTERKAIFARLISSIFTIATALFLLCALVIAPELIGMAAILFGLSLFIKLAVCLGEPGIDILTLNKDAKKAFQLHVELFQPSQNS